MKKIEEIYSQNVQSVYRYAFSKLGNKDQAEDVTSEVFKRFIEKYKDLQEGVSEKGWLITAARNIMYEKYRSAQKVGNFAENEEVIDENMDIEKVAVTADLKNKLLDFMNRLDDLTKEIITLRIWEELAYKEISVITGLSVNAAKLRFSRGIKTLKGMADQEEKKGKKLFAIPIGGILYVVQILKQEKQFLIDPKFSAQLGRDVSNLFVNKVNMNNLLQMMKAKWVIPALTGVMVIALGGGYAYVALNDQVDEPTEDTVTSSETSESSIETSVSSEQSSTVSSVESSSTTSSAEAAKTTPLSFTLDLKDYSTYSEGMMTFNATVPEDVSITELNPPGVIGGRVITGDGYEMTIQWPPELNFYYSYELMFFIKNLGDFGDMYRVKPIEFISGASSLQGDYYYVSNFSETEECNNPAPSGAEGAVVEAPCGGLSVSAGNPYFFQVICQTASEEGVAQCDEIANSLEVTIVK